MKIKGNFVLREVGGRTVAFSLGGAARGVGGVILNGSGRTIFELLQKGAEREEIYDALTEKYDVPRDVAVRDADAFIEKLIETGAIEN